jgi:hypothetical protein
MNYAIPLKPNDASLHSNWFQLDFGCNAALIKCENGTSETLIFVVFGTDFIAGLRVDRRTWVFLPNSAVNHVAFNLLGARNLPPVRQVSEDGRTYLQGLGSMQFKVWVKNRTEPLPLANASIFGRWVALNRIDGKPGQPSTLEKLVSFDSVSLIEITDVDNSEALQPISGRFGKNSSGRSTHA